VNVIDNACQMQDAKFDAQRTKSNTPNAEVIKAATSSAIQALELFTHSEKVGLIGEIEDAWAQLEARNAHQ
jgi:hypothetical protein